MNRLSRVLLVVLCVVSTAMMVSAQAETEAEPIAGVYSLDAPLTLTPGPGFAGVAVSPEGDKVAAISGFDNLIIAYNTENFSEIGRYEGGAMTNEITYTSDGRLLVAFIYDPELESTDIAVFDAKTMALQGRFQPAFDSINHLVTDSESAYFYGTSRSDEVASYTLVKFDLETLTVVAETEAIEAANFTPPYLKLREEDGALVGILFFEDGSQIFEWDSADLSQLLNDDFAGRLSYDGDGFYAYQSSFLNDDEVRVYQHWMKASLDDEEPTALGDSLCYLLDFSLPTDETYMVGVSYRCELALFNLTTGQIDFRLEGQVGAGVAVSPAGNRIYVAAETGLEVHPVTFTPDEG